MLHALDLARADLWNWCAALSLGQIHAWPVGVASVAFHLRHIARSLDRLLTYAEGAPLSAQQIAAQKSEMDASETPAEIFAELEAALKRSEARILDHAMASLQNSAYWEQARSVGSRQLPTTLGGLLVHVADHTQRHVGQAITTAKQVAD